MEIMISDDDSNAPQEEIQVVAAHDQHPEKQEDPTLKGISKRKKRKRRKRRSRDRVRTRDRVPPKRGRMMQVAQFRLKIT